MRRHLALSAASGAVTSPFDPTEYGTVHAWFDASDEDTLTGDPVTQWDDKSGNANHATTTNGSPTTRTINGLTAIDFDGSTDRMTFSGTGASGPLTIVYAAMLDTLPTGTSGQRILTSYTGSTTGIILDIYSVSDLDQFRLWSHGTTNWDTSHTPVAGEVFVLTGSNVSGNAFIQTNYGTKISATVSEAAVSTWNFGEDAAPNAATEWFDGAMCEMLMFSSSLSADGLLAVQSYLLNKWLGP